MYLLTYDGQQNYNDALLKNDERETKKYAEDNFRKLLKLTLFSKMRGKLTFGQISRYLTCHTNIFLKNERESTEYIYHFYISSTLTKISMYCVFIDIGIIIMTHNGVFLQVSAKNHHYLLFFPSLRKKASSPASVSCALWWYFPPINTKVLMSSARC